MVPEFRFKSERGLERNRFMACVLNSSVRLEIGSGRSEVSGTRSEIPEIQF